MDIIKYAKKVFDIQIEELEKVKNKIDLELEKVAKEILVCKGKVVITGIGKSGLIGKKIVATLASTGTYATFMNAAEGLHGDLGMIHPDDIVIAISNSGNSDEVVSIIPSIKKIGATLIAMTGNKNSKLGIESRYILDIGVEQEACPMNLAPTSSTTAALVMGDALATVLTSLKEFKPENFAIYHPGGSLGRRLLTKVSDLMHPIDGVAIVRIEDNIEKVILQMTNNPLGIACVEENKEIVGIITEGDIRRALLNSKDFFSYKSADIMTKSFTSVQNDIMAIEALEIMENRDGKISVVPVIENKKLIGVVRIHDLLSIK